MKTKLTFIAICYLLSNISFAAFAQGTAFTYQGRLQNNGSPASGSYNLTFSLFNVNPGGTALAGPVTTNGVIITNGLFMVTLDFGAGVWNGETNWLQIGVETNGTGSFTTLAPRQQLTPTPYAIFAEGANASGISGTIPAGNLGGTYGGAVNFNNGANSFDGSFYGAFYGSSFVGGTFVGDFVGNGSGLTDVWQTTGNSGTTAGVNFLGTTDNQPLELHVNGLRALRLEPTTNTSYVSGAVNVIQGSEANFALAGAHGATIAGGGADFYFGGNVENLVASDYGTIGGGVNNEIQTNAYESTIAGGNANSIQPGAFRSTIGGGWGNAIETNASTSVIGGGQFNLVNAPWAVIAGGFFNTNAGGVSFIGAGDYNNIQAGSPYSVIGGGYKNSAAGAGVFVGGGGFDGSTFAGNQANANASTIGGGLGNNIQFGASYSTIGGGQNNFVSGISGYIGGGGYDGTLRAGNQVYANASTIGGGVANTIQSYSIDATIGGGGLNIIQTNNQGSVIGGGYLNQIQSSTFVGVIAASTIAGGVNNVIQTNALYATIGGGGNNTNGAFFGTIPGGDGNYAAGNYSFAAGYHAQALYQGDFVWADSQNTNFAATTTDQVSFRCQGGVRFTSGSGAANQTVAWTPGSGSWSFPSDRNLKDRFETVDAASVLARIAHLPIVEWSYKGYSQRHIGAMAQDFHTLFPLNTDDKSLNDADLHGVELAAIQGLNEKVEDRSQKSEVRIQQLEAENAELKQRLDALEQIILKQKPN